MRTLLQLTLKAGTALIPCPDGKQVRLVSFLATIGGVQAGDQVNVLYQRETNVMLALIVGHECNGNESIITGMLGANNSTTNALTGTNTTATIGLPDVWWETQINVFVSTDNGVATAGVLLYEMENKAR